MGFGEFIKGFKKGQKNFGECISVIVNSALLSIVYVLGFGLTSIVAKILGKRFLDLKLDKRTETYWVDLNLTKRPLEEYYRQF